MGKNSLASRVPASDRMRDRLGLFLRRKYAGETKALARDMRSTVKAAENVMNGHWPNDLHLAAIVRRFGQDVWLAVFAPEIEPELARLSQEQRDLEERLELVIARRRQAEGGRTGDQQLLASATSEAGDRSPLG